MTFSDEPTVIVQTTIHSMNTLGKRVYMRKEYVNRFIHIIQHTKTCSTYVKYYITQTGHKV